ncbi:MAG: pentapeptide repeat-containing protein [Anaerolineae bacterium]
MLGKVIRIDCNNTDMYTTKRKLLIIFIALSLFLTANSYAQQTITVIRAIDGDTLKVLYREKVEKNIGRLRNTNSCPGCELFYANLRGANMSSANLIGANLFNAYLSGANLTNAYLMHSSLNGADIINANLKGADLTYADLTNAYMSGANFEGANLGSVYGLTIEQLSKVKTLYKARLDSGLTVQVKEKYPHLLENPEGEESKPDE